MRLLKIGSIPLPKIYIVDPTVDDLGKCRQLGVPYMVKPHGWTDEKLVKAVLWRTLMQKFPSIKWTEVLGFGRQGTRWIGYEDDPADKVEVWVPKQGEEGEVAAVHRENPGFDTCGDTDEGLAFSDGYRTVEGGLDVGDRLDEYDYVQSSVDNYIGDLGWYVDIEELQSLRVLPQFLDDIATAVKRNMANTAWMDGWSKKLAYPGGNYQGGSDLPNLIILDVSGSIPSGVAGTMVTLVETLRNQANADFIITSGRSEYWKAGDKLPNPDQLARYIGGCNECRQFYGILRKHVLGKHWGNVIVFGDWDAPNDRRFSNDSDSWLDDNELQSTKIECIMPFHTRDKVMPGYGKWAARACPKAVTEVNTSWVRGMWR